MAEQKTHTPGPWRWHRNGADWYIITADMTAEEGEYTDAIIDDGSAGGEYTPVIDVYGPNARLLVAAPDMLEALEAWSACCRHNCTPACKRHPEGNCVEGFQLWQKAGRLMDAAIAKAKGGRA